MKWTVYNSLILLVCSGLVMANQHQIGAAASGRAKDAQVHLESVIGQTASGVSGAVTSGFLSVLTTPTYLQGDVDGSGDINVSDVVYLIGYIFRGGRAPSPLSRGDVDCSRGVNISDAVFLISYIFSGGSAPHRCS